MAGTLHDHWVFWRQFREQFHSTGAVLPSGRFLARSLARFVGQQTGGAQVLEVGPGTGAVTTEIVRRLGPQDRFDLVELNEQFVQRLEQRFANEEHWRPARERSRVLHQPIEALAGQASYDVIVSGLPLNNFDVATVEHLLDVLRRLLRPGGTLSFFEYIAIRSVRSVVSNRQERERLRGIGQALAKLLGPHQFRCDWIWPNVPPAWVHHVRIAPHS